MLAANSDTSLKNTPREVLLSSKKTFTSFIISKTFVSLVDLCYICNRKDLPLVF